MTITIGDLATRLQCELLRGDASKVVHGVSNLADAGPGQLAPYTDEQYLTQLKATQAGAILVKRGANTVDAPAGATLLACDDPEIAFINAVRIFNPERARVPGIHPTALIDPSVELGADIHVGPYVVIESGTRIGARCAILAHTFIGQNCALGDDCVIHPRAAIYHTVRIGHRVIVHSGSVVGADGFGYKFRGGKYTKIPHVGSVEIADDVEIGANTCIDRGTLGATRIGAGTKIDNLVQIGHNNEIGEHCILCGQVAIAGSCIVEDYVILGGNVGLADHCHMGKGSRAGAKTGVLGNIPAGQEVAGLFARERRVAIRAYSALMDLPVLMKRVKELEKRMEK